jgi:LuxR family maltose regulon positive regulatory protein
VGQILDVLQNESGDKFQNNRLVEPLSERELQVLRLIVAGLSNRQIAQDLVISLGTAKTHIHNIYGKLDVSSRAQAIARAREFNLV